MAWAELTVDLQSPCDISPFPLVLLFSGTKLRCIKVVVVLSNAFSVVVFLHRALAAMTFLVQTRWWTSAEYVEGTTQLAKSSRESSSTP